MNESTFQMQWWEPQAGRESCAISLRCYLMAFPVFRMVGNLGPFAPLQRIHLMFTKMLGQVERKIANDCYKD
jgi:hypothetical protein